MRESCLLLNKPVVQLKFDCRRRYMHRVSGFSNSLNTLEAGSMELPNDVPSKAIQDQKQIARRPPSALQSAMDE